MKPTPTELALIAAAIARGGDAKQFIGAARELYAACAAELTPQALPPKQKVDWEKVTVDDVLDLAMHNQTPSRRRTLFHHWLASYIGKYKFDYGKNPTDEEIERETRNTEELIKNNTEEREILCVRFLKDFPAWHKARVSSKRTAAAQVKHKKTAAARRANEIERAANSKAIETKSRVEHHDPETLAVMAENQQHPTGKKRREHLHD